MSKITDPILPSNVINLDARKQNQIASMADFDAMLFDNDSSYNMAGDLLSNLIGSRNDDFSLLMPEVTNNKFPFSLDFESTFGLSGPLPAYITMITEKLGLSASQNKALQDISVRNKDATKSPESVQKIAKELKEAGFNFA